MLPLEDLTLSGLLARTARTYPTRPAVWFDGKYTTYAELERQVIECAGRLMTLGVRRGDRVAILSDPRPYGIAAMYAVEYIGAVAVMLNTSLNLPELLPLIEQTGAEYLLLGHADKGDGYFEAELDGAVLPECLRHIVSLRHNCGTYPVLGDLVPGMSAPCARRRMRSRRRTPQPSSSPPGRPRARRRSAPAIIPASTAAYSRRSTSP